MPEKTFPLTKQQLEKIIEKHPTPFHIYDERGIRETAKRMIAAFSDAPGWFINYFAVKATPNPHILKILREENMGADCSSIPELHLAKAAGFSPAKIMFTSNNTSGEAFREAHELGAVINLDDITFIDYLQQSIGGLPKLLCLRLNPGELKQGNEIIGNPSDAKYGLRPDQIMRAYTIAKDRGVERFGMHTMVASNELDPHYFIETAKIVFRLAAEVSREVGIKFDFINLGGGIGIPYRPGQQPVDLGVVSRGVLEAYEQNLAGTPSHPVSLYMECGRIITGPNGWIVSRVRHPRMEKHKLFVGIDAPTNMLLRSGIYQSAYHHITVLGREHEPHEMLCDVVSGLCENMKFGKDRRLPVVREGDVVIIHDTGAHGWAMGNNYNGELRTAELLLKPDGSVQQIRKPETEADYFATLDFPGLPKRK